MTNLQAQIWIFFLVKGIVSTVPLVEIEQGKLTGKMLYDINGREFYSFRSIPYAKKPIGDLRFKAPKYPEPWDGILEANEDLPMCMQMDFSRNIIGQEDCLYLNVHTPKVSTSDLKPVMFFIHGGGFLEGSGTHEMFGPEFLIAEGIVLVTINYRLGMFGFLNFDNPSIGVPGNAGLKDQNMALRWVQNNIAKFGGDPNCVTIFGESAGGASVHMHMISPLSQGLFHRVIAQSGTALNVWNNGMSNSGVLAAKTLGFKSTDDEAALNFLQNQTAEKIMEVQKDCNLVIPIHMPSLIGQVAEKKSNEPAFLTDTPKRLIDAGKFAKVPFMSGHTDAEAIPIDIFNLNGKIPLTNLIPYDLHITSDERKVEILDKVKAMYSIDEHMSLVDVQSDAYINFGVHNSMVSHAKLRHKNLYLYVFSADTKLNYLKYSTAQTAKLKGAAHIDDLGYLFKNKFTPSVEIGTPERKALDVVVKLWTNFAKFGDPNAGSSTGVVWNAVTETETNYLDIGADSLKASTDPFKDRMQFWVDLYQNYTQEEAIRIEKYEL